VRRFGPDAWKSVWPLIYKFVSRNEGEAEKSGWALDLVAPRRWSKICPLALFRQHRAAQGHGFVLCFLSDLWPEFAPWIQRGWTDMYRYWFYVKGVVSAELWLNNCHIHARSCFGIEWNRLLAGNEFVFLQKIRLLCLLIEENSALQTANKWMIQDFPLLLLYSRARNLKFMHLLCLQLLTDV